MAKMDQDTLKTLTQLARIQCDEEQQEKLLESLSAILTYIEKLREVDTEGVPACNSVLEDHCSVMREDEADESLSKETFLDNSPSHVGGMIRVPPVIKF